MTPTLPDLVAPLTETDFITLLQERTRTLVRSSGHNRWQTLLDWDTLDHLLETATYPLDKLRVQRESTLVPPSFFVRDQRIDPAALSRLLDQGVSLIFNGLDEYVPKLRQLCRDIAARTREHISAEAVVTSGKGGALRLHYDPEDIAVLQVAGTKRWKIHDATITHPVRGLPKITPPQGVPVFDEVLQPGDFLFVPGGQWHHCENGPARSLHVSILWYPPNGRHLMTSLGEPWLSDAVFRQPLTRHSDGEDLATHEAMLKKYLIEQIQAFSLADYLARESSRRPESRRICLQDA